MWASAFLSSYSNAFQVQPSRAIQDCWEVLMGCSGSVIQPWLANYHTPLSLHQLAAWDNWNNTVPLCSRLLTLVKSPGESPRQLPTSGSTLKSSICCVIFGFQERICFFSPATCSVVSSSTTLSNLPPQTSFLKLSRNSCAFVSGDKLGKPFGEHSIPCFIEIKQNTTSISSISKRLTTSSILGT